MKKRIVVIVAGERKMAKVFKIDDGEYVVQTSEFISGKWQLLPEECDYFTDDKEDALATAHYIVFGKQ